MINMIKPARLNPGDKIAAVTLSWGGPGQYPSRYEKGKRQLEEMFKIELVETPHTLKDAEKNAISLNSKRILNWLVRLCWRGLLLITVLLPKRQSNQALCKMKTLRIV
jgi:hypothetical protein